MLSGQQNQLASGQQPAGQEVSSGPHCLFLAIFMSWAFLATKGQSAAVAAQYMLSGQQNQLASGQQPAGQEVSSGPHCLFLAIFMSSAFLATKGQSAAVAAQYSPTPLPSSWRTPSVAQLRSCQTQLPSWPRPKPVEISSRTRRRKRLRRSTSLVAMRGRPCTCDQRERKGDIDIF